jgi:hypothetical protein
MTRQYIIAAIVGLILARIIHDSTSFFISARCTRAIYLS